MQEQSSRPAVQVTMLFPNLTPEGSTVNPTPLRSVNRRRTQAEHHTAVLHQQHTFSDMQQALQFRTSMLPIQKDEHLRYTWKNFNNITKARW
jgi:hypothetical protein